MKGGLRSGISLAMAGAMVLVGAGIAHADIVDNDVENAPAARSVVRGGTLDALYWIKKSKDGSETGGGACNPTTANPANVAITAPSGITVAGDVEAGTSTLRFTGCYDPDTGSGQQKTASFTPSATAPLGDHSISHTTTGPGTYENKANFTLRVVPRAPATVNASAVSASQIDVSWTLSADHTEVTKYHIWRATSLSGSYSEIGSVDKDANATTTQSHSNTGLSADTEYCYKVASRYTVSNTNFDGPLSTGTCVKTQQTGGGATDTTPPAVTITKVTGTGSTSQDTESPFSVFTNIATDKNENDEDIYATTIEWSANENGAYAVKLGGTSCTDAISITKGANLSAAYIAGTSTAPNSVTSKIQSSALGSDGTKTVRVCATDAASNTGTASATVTKDTTAPGVTCPSAPTFLVNEQGAEISAEVTDTGGSGPAGSADGDGKYWTKTPVSTATMGSFSGGPLLGDGITPNPTPGAALTGTDLAGNTTTAHCAYNVQPDFIGFSSPVNNPDWINKMKAGQAVPFKWRLIDANGDPISTLTSSQLSMTVSGVSCAAAGSQTDAVEELAAGSSGLQNLGDGYYQVNWKSLSSYAGSCRKVTLNFPGALSKGANFQFTK